MKKTICIDPGHGGADPGAVNGDRYEAGDNLRLSLAVGNILSRQGHRVVFTHKGEIPAQTKLGLDARRRIGIESRADLFLSVHRNSFHDPAAKGIEVWIRHSAHTEAAARLLKEIAGVEHQANRGVKTGAYAVLYDMPMPAILLELGFLSNERDNELFDRHFDAYATAIAGGILAALGCEEKESTPEATPLYRVQVGAFTVRENAERLREALLAKGYPSFVVKEAG